MPTGWRGEGRAPPAPSPLNSGLPVGHLPYSCYTHEAAPASSGHAGLTGCGWPDWLWLPWLWLLWLWLPWRYRLSETIAGTNKALRESAGRLIGSAFHEM